MGRAIGIDLGTTYSAVAYVNDLGKPEILPNREGEPITPSVVLFQGDEPLVGSMAKRSAPTAPYDTVQFVKRSMGEPDWRFRSSKGGTYTPEEVSAVILKRLKEDAELALGEPITDAVITVPAYFDDARRRATMDAGRIAGLNVLRVLNEPTAAALAYGIETAEPGTILVFDLGGGTFDVTVMRVEDGEFDVLATDGDRNLGGFDWDNALLNWVNEQVQAEGGPDLLDDDMLVADLRDRVELAKRSLTSIARTNVVVTLDGRPTTVGVTRDQFEDVSAGLLARSRRVTEAVVQEAGLSWSDIDRVLLVGGSTRMPMVRAMVETLSGRAPERGINPDEVVALGAAVQAALGVATGEGGDPHESNAAGDGQRLPVLAGGGQIAVRDVNSHGLGVIVHDPDTGRAENSVIIARNTKIPAQESQQYATSVDQQTEVRVQVTQGDDEDPDFVSVLGDQVFRIPAYPRNAPLKVTFSYDVDQIIHIEVVDLTAGVSLGTFEIDNDANLSAAEVDVARQRLLATEVG